MHLRRRWWWLVGWAFPNLEHRHHLAEQADRARGADLPWYGLPPDVAATRTIGGQAGFSRGSTRGGKGAVHASTVSVRHARASGAYLQVTVQRRGSGGSHPHIAPIARLALPLVRHRDGFSDPRLAPHTVEEFHQAQERALAELAPEPLDVRVDGVTRTGEMLSVADAWAAWIPIPEEDFDLELTGHAWRRDGLALVVIADLEPYIAGSRGMVGPLLLPRRPRLPRRRVRQPNRG